MNMNKIGTGLYLINFALLFTHEIDSAFWKEWELFGIPGGVQVFLLLNFILLMLLSSGSGRFCLEKNTGICFLYFWLLRGFVALSKKDS